MPFPPAGLTLIVATALSPSTGIGHLGTLPWGLLQPELSYFARVTKRFSPSPLPSPSSPTPTQNALIMGRKTWASIPAARRPLAGRLNLVVSRTLPPDTTTFASFSAAVQAAREAGAPRVFVIGGAQIYAEALASGLVERVLLTAVGGAWECDVFFPLDLLGGHTKAEGWRRAGGEEMDSWVGENVPRGKVRAGEVEFEFMMFVRE
ncbi:MAG: dihydrofolate reductase [Trizodia sp. TS-e1964]|nr:MAG: dihydrofolate reductase [Trizodia sp. TS-e1964]